MLNYATVALHRLTKKNQRFECLEEQDTAFEKLKAMIMTAPVLERPHLEGTTSSRPMPVT